MKTQRISFLLKCKKIVPEMQELPFFHHNIECFCPKFVLFEGQWVGSVLTPWMISVVILPGPQQTWEPRELGDKITVQLPYKALTFTVSGIETVPQYFKLLLAFPRLIRILPTNKPSNWHRIAYAWFYPCQPNKRRLIQIAAILFKAMVK